MDIVQELREITVGLDREGIEYALCGGLAMAVYALPRATLDIDMMIEADSLARAKKVVEPLGFTLSRATMEFHDGEIRISRLCKMDPRTSETLVLDFLLVTDRTAKVWESRRDVDWEGKHLKVVSPEGLILLKTLRRSGKDRDDIEYLRKITDED